MIDIKQTDVQKKNSKPNVATQFIVAVFFIFIGLLMKSFFGKWCHKAGLNGNKGFVGLLIVLWVAGVAIMLLTYIGYLLFLLFKKFSIAHSYIIQEGDVRKNASYF